jgi:predicted nucleic acid-binding protein
VYLVDTNVISEARKAARADAGVHRFFEQASAGGVPLYLSAITVGELRRGVELMRHRGDGRQAQRLEHWLEALLDEYADHVLGFDSDTAQLWGALRVPHPEHAIDKQIAATALLHGLTVVTRNDRHFASAAVPVLNPFADG